MKTNAARYKALAALLAVTAILYFALRPGARSGESRTLPHRVIFVTIDTLRADHVGAYGYPRNTTPFLDQLAREGVLFERAYSVMPHTAPSHASFFTGKFPFEHGVLRNHEALPDSVPSLQTYFSAQGITSANFPAVEFLNGKVGFPPSPFPLGLGKGKGQWYLHAEQVVNNALQWLQGQPPLEDFFVWLHFYDVHQWQGRKYIPEKYFDGSLQPRGDELAEFLIRAHGTPEAFFGGREKMLEGIEGYDARLRYVDDQLARFSNELRSRGLDAGTVWIVTSDHGEGLGNHNYEGHGEFLYNEQLHIPLIVHAPDRTFPSQRAGDLVRAVDLYPTILELFGATLGKDFEQTRGVSLLPLLRGEELPNPPAVHFAERRPKDERSFRRTWRPGEVYSVQTLGEKLIEYSEGPDELYDLHQDPFELQNEVGNNPAQEQSLRDTLDQILNGGGPKLGSDAEPELTDEAVEELKTLGYM